MIPKGTKVTWTSGSGMVCIGVTITAVDASNGFIMVAIDNSGDKMHLIGIILAINLTVIS